jgi:hypothetical protein
MADIVLTIKTNFGLTTSIDVNTSTTVEQVKSILFGMWNMPPSRQVLLVGRDQLHDKATLEECFIYADATVDMLFLEAQ